MRESVRRRYEAMAESGGLEPDAIQRALADALDRLITQFGATAQKSKKSSLGWLFARGSKPAPPRGLYIWGPVGRGKTLLMDLFFAAVQTERKRRVHFHEFMGEVQERLNRLRQRVKSGEASGGDPIAAVAAEIAVRVDLLCFDEFSVTDIADAMILGRLFEQLFGLGLTVVATSNAEPNHLYKDGLNRPLFLPFIALLKERMQVFHLDAPRDYRLDSSGSDRRYVTPLGTEADRCLDAHFRALTGLEHGRPRDLIHKGRRIVIPEAADGVARFTFRDLCERPLGAGDYLKIAAAFHTIIISGIPVLGPARRNEAKRLINLIDTIYDNHVRLIVSAEAEPDELWRGQEGVEALEFARTASRLVEMRSDAYWAASQPGQTKTARAG
ncbi:MAG TPA: cell division protein ZapE [Propylenella sp.]|nr:cell division protein ZapE [Propylenella sp.]